MTNGSALPFQDAVEQLRLRGVDITTAAGEFVVRCRKGHTGEDYRTDDIQDALAHAQQLAELPPDPPPLGPLGKGNKHRQWRARMYRHNNAIAGKRRRAAAAEGVSPTVGSMVTETHADDHV